ncbi:hypothetical protein LTR53_005329 [Teratosphaeriaceae sp. CCFEE 6253]|nr:hypothetical protein LTR53_005329 [Teratosphaeriaceae sp. CCFEE 6253]
MEVPTSLSFGFLPFPDTHIGSNLAAVEEEHLNSKPDHEPPYELDASGDARDPNAGDAEPARKRSRFTYCCAPCGKSYTEKRALARHKHTELHARRFGLARPVKHACAHPQCPKTFSRDHDRLRHEAEMHKGRKRQAGSGPAVLRELCAAPKDDSKTPSVYCRQDQSFVIEDDATMSSLNGWDLLAPQLEVYPGPANWSGYAEYAQEPQIFAPAPIASPETAPVHGIHLGSNSETPEASLSKAKYRQSQSWLDTDTDTEDELDFDSTMVPRPDTQLSIKTSKSSAYDSAIDLSEDQPHEPKRPSITTFDYRTQSHDDNAAPSPSQPADDERQCTPSPHPPPAPKASIIQRSGKTTILPAPTPTLCAFCDRPFPGDEGNLMAHLREHLEALRGDQPHTCRACHIGFVHKADLERHRHKAETLAHCGFYFEHRRPCRGHHPPAADGPADVALSDRDSFLLCDRLRHWEMWQLRAYIAQINDLAAARRCPDSETRTCYSIEALKPSRESISSYAVSVNTHGSAPCDTPVGGQLDIGGLRHRMQMLSLRKGGAAAAAAAVATRGLHSSPSLARGVGRGAEGVGGGGGGGGVAAAAAGGRPPPVKVLGILGRDVAAVLGHRSPLYRRAVAT